MITKLLPQKIDNLIQEQKEILDKWMNKMISFRNTLLHFLCIFEKLHKERDKERGHYLEKLHL